MTSYKRINEEKALKVKVMLTFIVIIIGSMLTLKYIGGKIINGSNGNIFYTNILNYCLPVLEQGNNIGVSEHKIKLKEDILNALGINIHNPLSIIKKEIPMLASTMNYGDAPLITFDPFNVKDESVVKNSESKPNINTEDSSLKKKLDPNKPEVLIYHTHTTESFAPGSADSKDNSTNIVAVGDVVASELQDKYGISVIHDSTLHNDMYTLSYKRSRATVENYLKKYGDFKLIIDLHRDSGGNKESVTATVNEQKVARFMFVISKDRNNYGNNKPLVDRMIATANKLYPGAMRQTPTNDYIWWYNHGSYHFNQDLRDNVILIEMGTENNTLDEAKNTAKIVARLIAEELNRKK